MSAEAQVSFDPKVDAAAIVFSRAPVARTVDVGDGRLLDLDDEGRVVAVEVLGASAGFTLVDLAEEYGFLRELAEVETELSRIAFAREAELA